MTFHEWAAAEGLTHAQVRSFERAFGVYDEGLVEHAGLSEAGVESRVRIKLSELGGRGWKNNKGAAELSDGTWLRYGLLNQSQRISDEIKSADLIGLRPRRIEPWMVGLTFAQFWCREVKRSGWVFTGTDHELAQARFLLLVLALGGDAGFISSEDQLT